MNVILILPLPLLHLPLTPSSHHCRDSYIFLLGPGPTELSDQGLILAQFVDVKPVRSICAWHLPNGDGLSGSSLCLSVSNWHTYSTSRHMQVAVSTLWYLPFPPQDPQGARLSSGPVVAACLCIYYGQYPALLHKL